MPEPRQVAMLERLETLVRVLREAAELGDALTYEDIESEMRERGFPVVRRRLQDHIERLKANGYEIADGVAGRRKTFLLDPRVVPEIPVERVKREMLERAYVSVHVSRSLGLTPNAGDLEALRKVLGERSGRDLSHFLEAFRIDTWPRRPMNARVFDAFARALRERRVVRFDYRGANVDPPHPIEAHPQVLRWIDDRWEVLAYTPLAARDASDGIRTYVVSRASAVQVLDAPAEDHSADVARALGQMFKVIRHEREATRVVVRFTPNITPYYEDARFHPTQEDRLLEDGSLELTFHTTALDEVARWAVGFGAQIEVIAPEAVREEVVRLHEAALEVYGGGPDSEMDSF